RTPQRAHAGRARNAPRFARDGCVEAAGQDTHRLRHGCTPPLRRFGTWDRLPAGFGPAPAYTLRIQPRGAHQASSQKGTRRMQKLASTKVHFALAALLALFAAACDEGGSDDGDTMGTGGTGGGGGGGNVSVPNGVVIADFEMESD